jgi:hypothetical protein
MFDSKVALGHGGQQQHQSEQTEESSCLAAAVPACCWQQRVKQHLPKALCVAAAVAAVSLAAPHAAQAAAAATSGGDSLLKSKSSVHMCLALLDRHPYSRRLMHTRKNIYEPAQVSHSTQLRRFVLSTEAYTATSKQQAFFWGVG